MNIKVVNVMTGEVVEREYTEAEAATLPSSAEIQAQLDEQRIAELKSLLASTDYVALPDYDKDKQDILAQRQAWRDEIRTLEANQ